VANPNHIGVHTFGDEHEDFFTGTQELEKDLIKILRNFDAQNLIRMMVM
jgi:hypothetical protein